MYVIFQSRHRVASFSIKLETLRFMGMGTCAVRIRHHDSSRERRPVRLHNIFMLSFLRCLLRRADADIIGLLHACLVCTKRFSQRCHAFLAFIGLNRSAVPDGDVLPARFASRVCCAKAQNKKDMVQFVPCLFAFLRGMGQWVQKSTYCGNFGVPAARRERAFVCAAF